MKQTNAITPLDFTDFGEYLKYLRRRAQLTQTELAIKCNYSTPHISNLEKNKRLPDQAALKALFVPALRLENEPELVIRLLELAAKVREAPTELPEEIIRPSQTIMPRPILSTPEGRNRYAMLQNVRKFWIEGVLENSLYITTLLELGLKQAAGQVENPWETILRKPDLEDEPLPASTRIIDVFEQLNGKLLILGDPGSGKTTSLLELARDLLSYAEADDAHPIPVVFNLSSWSEERKLLNDWLIDELSGKYLVPRTVAREWLANDMLLLLLDGLDEVALQYRDTCMHTINTYREEHGFADIVVCSRTADYAALTNRFKLNGAIVIQPLDDAQIDLYLTRLGPELSTLRKMVQEDEALIELSRSPLMLSILVLAYQGVSSQDIPTFDSPEGQRKHLFDVYVQRMFKRRGRETLYTQQETTHYLNWLARSTLQHSQSVFQIEKMQPPWLSENQQRSYFNTLRLIHATISALIYGLPFLLAGPVLGVSGWIFGLTMAIAGIVIAWVHIGSQWKRLSNLLLIGTAFGLAWGISIGSTYGLFWGVITTVCSSTVYSLGNILSRNLRQEKSDEQERIASIEILRFTRTKVAPWTIGAGAVMGILIVLGFRLVFGTDEVSISQLILALAGSAAVFAVLYLAMSGLTASEVTIRTNSNQGIWSSLANANVLGILVSIQLILVGILGIAPVTSLEIGLASGIALGISNSYSFWFIFGGYSVLQHIALRYILYRNSLTPRNYAQFLDFAASRILLRKVGGGYIFIHRYLLEYFANLN